MVEPKKNLMGIVILNNWLEIYVSDKIIGPSTKKLNNLYL